MHCKVLKVEWKVVTRVAWEAEELSFFAQPSSICVLTGVTNDNHI